jgi:hypothetical protein
VQAIATLHMSQMEQEILAFLNLAYVHCLNNKEKGGIPDLYFNVYADGNVIQSADTWINIQNFFHTLPYSSQLLGKGTTLGDKFYCPFCCGKDHPNGMCPFSSIPGWKLKQKEKEQKERSPYGSSSKHFDHGRGCR